jgi:hypothetical protein
MAKHKRWTVRPGFGKRVQKTNRQTDNNNNALFILFLFFFKHKPLNGRKGSDKKSNFKIFSKLFSKNTKYFF